MWLGQATNLTKLNLSRRRSINSDNYYLGTYDSTIDLAPLAGLTNL